MKLLSTPPLQHPTKKYSSVAICIMISTGLGCEFYKRVYICDTEKVFNAA